jgi:hypothetical protein
MKKNDSLQGQATFPKPANRKRRITAMMMAALIMFFAIAVFSGCAASGANFTRLDTAPDKAVIYIYRKGSIVGAANSAELFINGQHIARLGNGGYCVHVADPGPIEIKALQKFIPVMLGANLISKLEGELPLHAFEALPGQEYFYQFKVTGYKLKPISKEVALEEMKGLQLFENAQEAQQAASPAPSGND